MADRSSLDDDTINAVCAEVARQREALPDGDKLISSLQHFAVTSEAMLDQAAWRLRAYEALRKRGA